MNFSPIIHCWRTQKALAPLFALTTAPFRLLDQLRTLPRSQRTPPFHRLDRYTKRACCSANSPLKQETLPTRSGRPGRSSARYVTEQSSPSTGLDTQKKIGTAAIYWGCGPSACSRRGRERDSTQRGERQAARDGDNKQGLVCYELQARHVNPNRGPWRVYATAPLVQGSSQISPAQYTAIPLESPAVAPASPSEARHIVDGPLSELLLGLMF